MYTPIGMNHKKDTNNKISMMTDKSSQKNVSFWQEFYMTIVVLLNTSFILVPICIALYVGLLLYSGIIIRVLLVFYTAHLMLDRTAVFGGNRWISYETIEWVRALSTFRASAEYFPAVLHKTTDLDPKKAYLFAYHPHGVIGMGVNCTLNTNGAGFQELFPGLRRWGVTLREVFYVPILREYILAMGFISADKEALRNKLEQGDSVVLSTGGAAEALYAQPGRFTTYLKKRVGFVKLARQTKVPIVPCLGFGEEDVYPTFVPDPLEDKTLIWVLTRIRKMTRFSTPLLLSPVPRRKPIHVVVGPPVTFSPDSTVEECHAKYTAALVKLYEENKAKYGHEHIPLEIV